MKYKVETVYSDSDHPMASRVEDDEMQFIVDENGRYYPCDEFFYMVSIKEFEVMI